MKPKILIESSQLRVHHNPDPLTKKHFPTIPGVMETDWVCDDCGKTYSAITWHSVLWTTGRCPICDPIHVEKIRDEESRGSLEKRKENFRSMCPESYQDFSRKLLPRADLYDDVIAWTLGKKGLLLIGDSRMGKTRCAWQLMKRIYLIEGYLFESVTELQFSHKVAEFGRSEGLKEWIDRLCKIKVLFIDDLGKAVMTERVSAELFYVLEERMKNNRPVVATMQIDPIAYAQKISSRSGKEMAEAILNRLKEHCEVVQF
jgi:DNA replication protein DnaC